jgi:hypothetical protein|tara:strand:- start:1822 stop:2217 length:396 start_codon:yes stop_codon:yes gene_type:complete
MIKEKAILIFLGLVIIGLILESLFIVFPLDDKPQKVKKEFSEITSNKKNEDLVLLSVPGWGEDIFYDRSNIYDSLFTLTGITQFENIKKAIINGEIVQEGVRIKGFRVMDISEKKAVLKRDEYRVTLKLQE